MSLPARTPRGLRGPNGKRTARTLQALVRAYQALTVGRPSPCRYQPTCSAYAAQALETHGAGKGTVLAMRRVGRCHPWGGHGWDPVPDGRS